MTIKSFIILLATFLLALASFAWAETWECPQCGNDFYLPDDKVEGNCPYCYSVCLWFVCQNCGNAMIVAGDWEEFACPICGATYRAVFYPEQQKKESSPNK